MKTENNQETQLESIDQSMLTRLTIGSDERTKKLVANLQSTASCLFDSVETVDDSCDQLLLILTAAMEGHANTWDSRDCANAVYLCRNLSKLMKAVHPLVNTDIDPK